jgi:hypothetical protein
MYNNFVIIQSTVEVYIAGHFWLLKALGLTGAWVEGL